MKELHILNMQKTKMCVFEVKLNDSVRVQSTLWLRVEPGCTCTRIHVAVWAYAAAYMKK